VKDVIKHKFLISITVDSKNISKLNIALVKFFISQGMRGIVVCVDSPYSYFIGELERENLPTDGLYFIDVIRPGKSPPEADNVLFVDFPLNLSEMATVMVATAATVSASGELPFVLIDSVKALQMYSDFDTIDRFVSFLTDLRKMDMRGIVVVLEEGMEPSLSNKVKSLCDRNIRGFELKKGHSYLVKEKKPAYSFQIFKELVRGGSPGLCITRMLPQELLEEYGLEKIPIFLLAREAPQKEYRSLQRMEEIAEEIEKFMKESEDSVVLIDGLEYLITQYDFPMVLRFSHDLNKMVALHNSRLILPLDPRTLEERELAFLERDMEVLLPE
jgi:archaellum biogenesis ATPase FlaH